MIDSRDIEIIAGDREIDIESVKAEGPPLAVADTEHITDARSKFDSEKFMQEELTVIISQPSNKSEAQSVYIGHPLTPEWFRWKPRGVEIKLKRYEVAILCYAKGTEVYQDKSQDEEGADKILDRERWNLAYPFQVIHDPSGHRGADWLKTMLRNQY
jgi:hypothetical protein